ncbi:hypothetical protein [Kribbella sp. NPDC051770]|uniref:hypothetical protein n=1 Tax=Kribbella sp. NPDC051770 TaxID=3155413 RepID=UPI00343E0550
MRNLTVLTDKLVGLVVPKVTAEAQAQACYEVRSYCDPDCSFWWWRRAHIISCNGVQHIEFECCGCGC